LQASITARKVAGVPLLDPISSIDLAETLGVKVRFVDINMEGMYKGGREPRILISSLRPLARRNFTCGHELGHHFFGHGSSIDELQAVSKASARQPEEYLANVFSGFLLMPPPAVTRAFVDRGLTIESCRPQDLLRIASVFGVGYDTLVTHLSASNLLTKDRAKSLRRVGPAGARKELLELETSEALVVIDEHFEAKTLDMQVGMLALVPLDVETSGDCLVQIAGAVVGKLFEARCPAPPKMTTPEFKFFVSN